MPTVMSPVKAWTEVAEWEEPRHSGPFDGATLAHFIPLCNTSPHFLGRSAALNPLCGPDSPLQRAIRRVAEGGSQTRKRGQPACTWLAWAQSCAYSGGLQADLRLKPGAAGRSSRAARPPELRPQAARRTARASALPP